jgi:glycosyltransferase involved in cell wall biosynthesis
MNFSIIIPAHNEEFSIEKTVTSIEQGVSGEYEIVVVNDHSRDGTADVVRRLSLQYKNLRLLENTDEPGFANALRAGFYGAGTDVVVPVMADLCDDPHTINKMYEKIGRGFDVVCGSRYMKGGRKIGGPKLKSFFSRFVGLSLNFLIGIPTHDIANAFKMYRKRIFDDIEIKSRGFEISVEVPLKAFFAGYAISEVSTIWRERSEGKSKFDISKQGSGYFKLYLWALVRRLFTCPKKKK